MILKTVHYLMNVRR